MLFFVRRMRYRLVENRPYFLLALLLPIIYLGVMAYKPSIFTISHSFSSPGDAPVAKPESPTDSILISELTATPSQIVRYIKSNYLPHLILNYPMGYSPAVSQIQEIYSEATTTLSFRHTEDNRLFTTYTGKDRVLGHLLVTYYCNTLLKQIQAGYKRRNMNLPPQLKGSPEIITTVESSRLLWDSARVVPALMLFAAGFIVILLSQGILEFLDPSYKSEKQIAEHTLLPILGSLPNLNMATATATASHHHDM